MEKEKVTNEKKDYYIPKTNIVSQIRLSSKRRKSNMASYIVRKIRNHCCEMLAFKCPINQIRVRLHRWRGVNIGERVMLGMEVVLDHAYPELITLEQDCSLAGYNYILAHSIPLEHFENILDSYTAPVVVKKGAWVAVGSMIMPGVTIGEYSIVRAGSVVTESVPAYTIVSGNPAEVVGRINPKWITKCK